MSILESITKVTDKAGNKVEIVIKNLEKPQEVKGMNFPCEAFLEIRYADEPEKAYGRPMFFDKKLTSDKMDDLSVSISQEIDSYKF